jgi:hypothetical protein
METLWQSKEEQLKIVMFVFCLLRSFVETVGGETIRLVWNSNLYQRIFFAS